MDACIEAHIRDGEAKPEPVVEILETAEEVVEIVALPEDQTQEALFRIQERQDMANPRRVITKQLHCTAQEPSELARKATEKNKGQAWIINRMKSAFPPLYWFPALTMLKVRADVIAGVTVGVMVIPQGMSYANIAGLPYIYGMYSACVPTFAYALFGQSRQLAVGPVAMVSLLVEAGLRDAGSTTEMEYVNLAILTSLAVGIMQVAASVLRLGFMVSFLGHPVTSGFTSAAAIIIGLSQVKYILGYDIEKSQFIYTTVGAIIDGIGDTKWLTLVFGIVSILFLMMTRKIARAYPRISLLGPLGPLVLCTIGILMIVAFPSLKDDYHVKAIGHIPSGLMPLSIQDWDLGKFSIVLPTAMSACLIGYMESIAIGKNLAAKNGYEIEPGQELFALGIANIVGACFSCYPVTGSFSRSAVNQMTGACTQLAGMVTAVMMLLTLFLLTPLFEHLPKFVLAAIVINSVIPLVAYEEAIKLYKVKKQDCFLWVVAFIGTLFLGVLMGIFLAVALSLIIVIYESARPQITVLWRIPGTTIYRNIKQEQSGAFIPNVFICRIGSSLYFANAQYVKDALLAMVNDMSEVNKVEYIVLEMTPVISLDSTAVHILHDIIADFRARHIQIAFALVGNRVERTMRKADLTEFIGERWFFSSVNDAVYYCLRHQYSRRRRKAALEGVDVELGSYLSIEPKDEEIDGEMTTVRPTDEIGFSNDLHHSCTTVFINLVRDVPGFMSEITLYFKKGKMNVVRANVEPYGETGAKHTYHIKSGKTNGKLSTEEVKRLREQLELVMGRLTKARDGQEPSGAECTRVQPVQGSEGQIQWSTVGEAKMREPIMEPVQVQGRLISGNGAEMSASDPDEIHVHLRDAEVSAGTAVIEAENMKSTSDKPVGEECPPTQPPVFPSRLPSIPVAEDLRRTDEEFVVSTYHSTGMGMLHSTWTDLPGGSCFSGLRTSADKSPIQRPDVKCFTRRGEGWRAKGSSSACLRGQAFARAAGGLDMSSRLGQLAPSSQSGCMAPLSKYRQKEAKQDTEAEDDAGTHQDTDAEVAFQISSAVGSQGAQQAPHGAAADATYMPIDTADDARMDEVEFAADDAATEASSEGKAQGGGADDDATEAPTESDNEDPSKSAGGEAAAAFEAAFLAAATIAAEAQAASAAAGTAATVAAAAAPLSGDESEDPDDDGAYNVLFDLLSATQEQDAATVGASTFADVAPEAHPQPAPPKRDVEYEYNGATKRWEPKSTARQAAAPAAGHASSSFGRPPWQSQGAQPRPPWQAAASAPAEGSRFGQCRNFALGNCMFGARCRYSHDVGPSKPAAAAAAPAPAFAAQTPRKTSALAQCASEAKLDQKSGVCEYAQALAVRLVVRFENKPSEIFSSMAEAGIASGKDNRSTVKAIMRLCHPDKCKHPEAKKAMQILAPLLGQL
eukprot:CAMPEP_0178434114 /NCGR_PEP_ID=MMETSP0689_2-20121128/33257_1 /TAXON_ID=160604 /ORGANISM="Amphidinium massartii, Strain CS-259" /LENGTH=1417 /DNA_ID=CAMNT_0020056169 /DNA_START=102 /DNA_END=4355 /DNA_ORIENTATION=-